MRRSEFDPAETIGVVESPTVTPSQDPTDVIIGGDGVGTPPRYGRAKEFLSPADIVTSAVWTPQEVRRWRGCRAADRDAPDPPEAGPGCAANSRRQDSDVRAAPAPVPPAPGRSVLARPSA